MKFSILSLNILDIYLFYCIMKNNGNSSIIPIKMSNVEMKRKDGLKVK